MGSTRWRAASGDEIEDDGRPRHQERAAVLHAVVEHDRPHAGGARDRPVEAVAEPGPAQEAEAHAQVTALGNVPPGRPDAFLGVDVVVQPQRRQRGEHRVGIEQAVGDRVERLAAVLLEEGAGVVHDRDGTRVVVGMFGMEPPPEVDDAPVDVDGMDGAIAVAQRRLHVVARSRPHHERTPARGVDHEGRVVHQSAAGDEGAVLRRPGGIAQRRVREVVHVLVEVPVHRQHVVGTLLRQVDPVVG